MNSSRSVASRLRSPRVCAIEERNDSGFPESALPLLARGTPFANWRRSTEGYGFAFTIRDLIGRPPPPVREVTNAWQPPAQREPSLLGPSHFIFLNEHGLLEEVGWTGDARSKLWRYNQHYFDDLNARSDENRNEWHKDLLSRWVSANPPGEGDGWEPYPTSLRIVNWVKWALAGYDLPEGCVESLAVQARWLMRRLEFHLLGNHLFANAKALVFAGLYFNGPEAKSWLFKGCGILKQELAEQVLADGGHFERSTMYHALALEDILDTINVSRVYGDGAQNRLSEVLADLEQVVEPMRELASGDEPSGWRNRLL